MPRPPVPALLLLALACAAAGACKGKGHAEVDGVLIPQADGIVDAPAGATLAIPEGTETASLPLPEDDTVRLAIHRDVPWREVKDLVARVEAAGKRPVLLVGRRHYVHAIELEDELENEDDLVEVFTYVNGKVCVKPPDIPEALCAQQEMAKRGRAFIDRAYTRQFVREMRQRVHVDDILVHVPPDLPWADVIRAVDGARTCCGDERMRVALSDSRSELP